MWKVALVLLVALIGSLSIAKLYVRPVYEDVLPDRHFIDQAVFKLRHWIVSERPIATIEDAQRYVDENPTCCAMSRTGGWLIEDNALIRLLFGPTFQIDVKYIRRDEQGVARRHVSFFTAKPSGKVNLESGF